MIERGWPFLVARGRHEGHRTLLAPDFLVRARLQGVLSDTTAGTGRHQVELPQHGLVVLYDSAVTNAEELGDGEPALDQHGRPLVLRYGLVFRRRAPRPQDRDDLPAVRDAALATYRRFLADERRFTVEPSLPLGGHVREVPAAPPPPARRPTAAWPLVVAGVAVAAVAGGALLVITRDRGPHFQLARAAEESDCTPLHGVVTADRPVTLSVAWSPPGTTERLTFAHAGSLAVERNYPSLRAGATVVLSVSKGDTTRSVKFTCAP